MLGGGLVTGADLSERNSNGQRPLFRGKEGVYLGFVGSVKIADETVSIPMLQALKGGEVVGK